MKIFVASPGDVPERHGPVDKVVKQLNNTLGSKLDAFFDVVRWETHAPHGPSDRLQAVFNPLLDESDVALVLFWRRCGTDTGLAVSGTAEEYNRAIRAWRQRGSPRVLLYFSEVPAPPPRTVSEAQQMLEVARLREIAQADGLIGTYASPDDFSAIAHRDLFRLLSEIVSLRRIPMEADLAAALGRQRDACIQADRPFHTPSLLVALLKTPDGILVRALESIQTGLAEKTQGWLERAEQRLTEMAEHRYMDFEWMERRDLQAALELSRDEGADLISERHLLLSVLRLNGSTVSALRTWLGADKVARLNELLRSNLQPIGYGEVFADSETDN